MKMEDHFKEMLRKAVENEPPVHDAWSRLERGVRRDRGVRLTVAIAGAAAVIAASTIVVPKLGARRFLITPSTIPPSPTSTPSFGPPPGLFQPHGWQIATSEAGLWITRYPKGWTSGEFEGVTSFQPRGVQSVNKGLPTFDVDIRFQQGERPYPPPAGDKSTYRAQTRGDGRVQYKSEVRQRGSHVVTYRIDWMACAAGETPCRIVSGTLVVRIHSDTPTLWSRYASDAELIASSIVHLEDPTSPRPAST